MKKVLTMIALAAICLGTASASTPIKASSDTTMHKKTKMKKKGSKMKMKSKMKDTATKM